VVAYAACEDASLEQLDKYLVRTQRLRCDRGGEGGSVGRRRWCTGQCGCVLI
jgi:hypothetical protein